ncbi:uncharacterized protein LOC129722393 [Wyeomyia smithii]|uniref:uncharacterized protein LOC129722393 n=1 Tax=Wyeomyia smithii TaxID=174621 RepID=UPI0024680A6F|nr:uncharacterized protein LOC129722393 [Wyeomyia smithii]
MALLVYGTLVVCVGLVLSSPHSPYSLQAAVDALHRREAQLALRDEATGEPLDDEGYWLEPSDEPLAYRPNRQRLNKILANYLRRDDDLEEEPYDPYDLEARKRSIFRERDALAELPAYPTVFRERELEKPYLQRPDMSSDFLKEIDRQANIEREEKYLDRLRQLWDKYQQQENEIEQELFDEDRAAADDEAPYFDKRQGYPISQSDVAAVYYGPPMQEKKRTMPMLPWLPASRRKRFPVAKRSPKPETAISGTDEKVAKDLQALFEKPVEQKKKRSSEPEPVKKLDKMNETKSHEKQDASGEHDHDDRSSEESHEHDHDHDHGHDHDHEHDHESSEEFEGEDDDKRKRSVKKRSNLEVVKEDQIIPGDIGEYKAKKSIQWNKYFGMDRRKKSISGGAYPLSFYKSYDEDRKKKSLNQEKLDNMDRKLKTIEDLILDQTVKYTGDHEGGLTEPEDLQKMKDKVVSRLATAYSIEKMRHTLEKLKDSVGDDSDPSKIDELSADKRDDKKEKAKRVAVKKEKAEYDHSQHSMEPSEKVSHDEVENDLDELDDDKKKKKKKRVTKRFQEVSRNDVPDFEEELGEGYGRSLAVESNECPLLDALERRCRGVDVLSGDVYQELLPACGAHQLCYLCGSSQTVCDLQYLTEADSICEGQGNCQSTARSALMILRGFPGPQLGPRECAKNPCLYRAMIEVGVSGL